MGTAASGRSFTEQDEILGYLKSKDLTCIASDIPGLEPCVPYANCPTVSALQHQYTLDNHGDGITLLQGFVPLPTETAGGETTLQARLRIVTAPASFSKPLTTKQKICNPAFEVELQLRSCNPMRINSRIDVLCLDERQVAGLPKTLVELDVAATSGMDAGHWSQVIQLTEVYQSNSEANAQQMPVLDAMDRTASTASTSDGATAAAVSFFAAAAAEHKFGVKRQVSFENLAFNTPSGVRPRWLLFVATLQNADGGPIARLMVHFLLPTIIMSRKDEQQCRAIDTLWPGGMRIDRLDKLPISDFRPWVRKQLFDVERDADLRGRHLNAADYSELARRAGIGYNRSPEESAVAFWSFNKYILGCREAIACVQNLFQRQKPTIICGFSVTRTVAEQSLCTQPAHTFLLRFSENYGDSLVLSTVQSDGTIKHLDFNLKILQSTHLDKLLQAMRDAEYLLDIESKTRFRMSEVFDSPSVVPQTQPACMQTQPWGHVVHPMLYNQVMVRQITAPQSDTHPSTKRARSSEDVPSGSTSNMMGQQTASAMRQSYSTGHLQSAPIAIPQQHHHHQQQQQHIYLSNSMGAEPRFIAYSMPQTVPASFPMPLPHAQMMTAGAVMQTQPTIATGPQHFLAAGQRQMVSSASMPTNSIQQQQIVAGGSPVRMPPCYPASSVAMAAPQLAAPAFQWHAGLSGVPASSVSPPLQYSAPASQMMMVPAAAASVAGLAAVGGAQQPAQQPQMPVAQPVPTNRLDELRHLFDDDFLSFPSLSSVVPASST